MVYNVSCFLAFIPACLADNVCSLPTGRAYQVNVLDPEHVENSVNQIVKEFNGRLDIFVANSGIPWSQGPALDGQIDHYRKVIGTDLDGTFYCARAVGRHFRRQAQEGTDLNGGKLDFKGGSFIATASMSGHIVNIPQLQAAYNAAKAGVIHLSEQFHFGTKLGIADYRLSAIFGC